MVRFSPACFASLLCCCLACIVVPGYGQVDSVSKRIILVGDAGKLENGTHPELDLLQKVIDIDHEKNTLLYLGDNIYPVGLPSVFSSSYEDKRKILDDQIEVVRGTQARAIFLPGNHDWMKGRPSGWQQILNQGQYVNNLGLPNVQFLPEDGCPGPVELRISEKIVVVIIDSQWWLHRYEKPGIRSGCDSRSEEELLTAIRDIVDRNRSRLLIFAAHHPFKTYGRHGGFYGIKQHIFPFTETNKNLWIPLPVLGSLYPISRGVFGDIQDTRHPIYRNFSASVDSILKDHPYCIRVAGHEHNLQLIQLKNQFYIVSGGGAKQSEITEGPGTLFADNGPGFGMIEVMINGQIKLRFFSASTDTTGKAIFETYLPPLDTTSVKAKPYKLDPFPDSVTFKGLQYYRAGKFKQWLLGENYRNEWTQPLRVPVFDIGKEYGGLRPTQRGGGMQTKSLRLEDAQGHEYVLRTIEKFPDNTLPEEFRHTIVKDAVVDGISASYPYAALSVPPLANAAGIAHAHPRLVWVPDDPRLGYYQGDFANTLCIFEEREPGNYDRTYSTEKVLEKVYDDNDDRVDQHVVLKARLFDMYIMDFDRHEDQWRWGTRDTGKGKIYFPIPRDRDQAFFVNDGFIPSFVRKPWIFPKFQGFRAKAININTFNFNARYFDRSFLNRLTEAEWKHYADSLMTKMTDSVIVEALQRQPRELWAYKADTIIQKLKERRKYFPQEAVQYYKFLAGEVDIPTSDKKERFEITRHDNGNVHVDIFKVDTFGNKSSKLYERLFHFGETEEIRLFGLGGEDHFVINGSGDKKTIRIRMIGGTGKDSFENNSLARRAQTVAYDQLSRENFILGSGATRNRFSNDADVNLYDRRAFRYNELVPGASIAFNVDDGLFLGASIRQLRHGFRREPFKFWHQLSANHAVATSAYNFRYRMEAIDVIDKGDLVFDARLRSPRGVLNFFKLGNETKFDRTEGKTIDYYRVRFDQADVTLLVRNKIAEFVSVLWGPTYNYFSVTRKENAGRIINFPSLAGLDSLSLYKSKNYIGPYLEIDIDNRNDQLMPTRGVNWKTVLKSYKGLGPFTKSVTQLSSDLSVFISAKNPAKLVVALRFGGGINFGDYEFFQAQYLSGTENLRGFRRFRFAGDRMAFNNLEVRYRLKDFETYLFPGAIGLFAFHDVGRVWVKEETSKIWHHGYGGGVWVAPARRVVFTAAYTFSKDGALPLVTFGFQF